MKPLDPKTYNSPQFIDKTVAMRDATINITIDEISLYRLMIGYTDNLFLRFLGKRFNRDALFGILSLFKKTLKKYGEIQIQDGVLFVSANNSDIRYRELFDPVVLILNESSIKSTHVGVKNIINQLSIKDILKAISISIRNFSKIREFSKQITKFDDDLKKYRRGLELSCISMIAKAISVKQILKDYKIQHICFDWDHGASQAIVVEVAKELGISTSTLVHGNIAIPTKFVPLLADKCFTWGELQNEFFINSGAKESHLIKVGYPNIRLPKSSDRLEISNDIPKGPKHWVGYAEQRVRSLSNEEIAADLNQCIEKLGDDWGLLIRPHPSQTYDSLVEIFEKYPRTWVVPKKYTSTEVLSQTSLFLVVDSTFSIDCIFYNTPLVFYNPDNRGLFGMIRDFVNEADAKVVTNGLELYELMNDSYSGNLRQLTNTNEMLEYASELIVDVDYNASKNIAKEIIKEIKT